MKETGIDCEEEDMKFLFNDPKFNCDVYTIKLKAGTHLKRMEPEKNGM